MKSRLALVLFSWLLLANTKAFAQFYISDPMDYGTLLGTISSCDDCAEEIVFTGAGQSIELFGTTYTSMFPSSNGLVAFGSGFTGFSPQPLDTQTFRVMIAGLFTDLDARPARSNVYLNDTTAGQLVITWVDMSRFPQDATNNNFQLVIRSDQFVVPAGEGQIGFFYGTIETASSATGGFGDGLADVNDGEVSLFNGPASDQSNRAPFWINLGSGGVPVDPMTEPTPATPVPVLPLPALLVLIGLMALCGYRVSRLQAKGV